MHLPELLLSGPPLLSEQVRQRIEELRYKIVKANYSTQFAQSAFELSDFRHATAGLIDGMDANTLSDSFRKTVRFTSYDSYAPLLARFLERPCKASAIVDLFAPGLPDFLTESSSTSGGLPKTFPKYNRMSGIRNGASCTDSNTLRKRTTAFVWSLWCDRVEVENEDGRPIATIYHTCGTVVTQRVPLCLDPERDDEKMATFILDHTTPYAVGFIKKWRSFLLIHALFAISSRSLEEISMAFVATFVAMIHFVDMEFDMLVECIANGTIPDLEGLEEVRQYLEGNISPDPERAAELRRLGRPSIQPGWCGHVWPNLRTVEGIGSGSFASSVPLAKWFLGPNTEIHSHGYASTETWIGSSYNPLELNQFKPSDQSVFEFLDVTKRDSISVLVQLWEVQIGRRYELVLTTPDGLWRYRLGDVVEICGFDPTDGFPIIKFIERRNVAIRFPDFMLTEEPLRAAMSSVSSNMLVKVVNWTAAIDERRFPPTIAFFVELAGGQVSDLALAPERVLNVLLQDKNVAWAIEHHVFRKPTIRLVRPGTFSDFLQLKLDEGSNNLGQIKVPVALPKDAYVAWFSNRVEQEL